MDWNEIAIVLNWSEPFIILECSWHSTRLGIQGWRKRNLARCKQRRCRGYCTEGSGQFIFPHIHEKTIPAHPRVFLGSPGLCWVMTRRSGHVSRPSWRLRHLEVRQFSALENWSVPVIGRLKLFTLYHMKAPEPALEVPWDICGSW